jgi:hypothetical protein
MQPPAGSNLRVKKVSLASDSLVLDTVSIIPHSFSIFLVDTSAYRLDFVRSILYWKSKPPTDSILLAYRVFPVKLNSMVRRLNYDSVINNVSMRPFEFNPNEGEGQRGLLDFGNLQANGSIGREVSFGNNQDAVVNSNFSSSSTAC